MRRPIACGTLLCALAVLAGGCGSTSTPTNPTPDTKTDTFTGTLATNAAKLHTFDATTAGQVIATLTAVGPDKTKSLGFSLGTFAKDVNGNGICQVVLDSPLALQGTVLTANASSAGSYCVRLYDSGAIPAGTTFTYTVTVSHP